MNNSKSNYDCLDNSIHIVTLCYNRADKCLTQKVLCALLF